MIDEIQKDKGHAANTRGFFQVCPSSNVCGCNLYALFLLLTLASLYGLIPTLLLTILVANRTYNEDKMLHGEFPEYGDCAKKLLIGYFLEFGVQAKTLSC